MRGGRERIEWRNQNAPDTFFLFPLIDRKSKKKMSGEARGYSMPRPRCPLNFLGCFVQGRKILQAQK
jgi:hypothetical protein